MNYYLYKIFIITNFFKVDGSFDFVADVSTTFFGETWDLNIHL
jgi:hypothetical protein